MAGEDDNWSPPENDFQAAANWAPPEEDFQRPVIANSPAPEASPGDIIDENPDTPTKQVVRQAVSQAGHSALAGWYGIGKGVDSLLTGKGDALDTATGAVEKEQAKAYRAPDSTVKSVIESKWNPMNWVQGAADYIADKSSEERQLYPEAKTPEQRAVRGASSPIVSTAIKAAPSALGAAAGVRGLMSGKVPAPVSTVTPELADAQSVVRKSLENQSQGAAAAAPDVSMATPELQQEIVNAGPANLNHEAMARQLRANTLPLPEGMDPLHLRKGSATHDVRQAGDEYNLREDDDTGGLLQASIKNNDQKLVGSMGEIHRRATPDTIQRTNAQHGQTAVDAIKEHDNNLILQNQANYKALADAGGGALPLDTGKTADMIEAKLHGEYLHELVGGNPVLKNIMGDLRSGPITFEKFEAARTRLAALQRGSDGNLAAAASIMRDHLENMPLSENAAHLKGLADQARAGAKARFDLINANPAYKAAINDNVPRLPGSRLHQIGAPSPLAPDFLNKYATGDGGYAKPAYIDRLKAAVPDQRLHDAIEGSTLNDLRDSAGISPTGEAQTGFKAAPFSRQVDKVSENLPSLVKPETAGNIEHLRQVANDENWSGKASGKNWSNSASAHARFKQIAERASEPGFFDGPGGHAVDLAASHLMPHFAPPLIFGKNLFKARAAEKAAEAAEANVRDAKLKFAQDATKPGAGVRMDTATAPQITRASGGRVSVDMLVDKLMNDWKRARKQETSHTKPLLGHDDNSIAKALAVAQEAI